MATGRRRDEWGRFASLMAVIVNCHRDPKRAPIEPERFIPRSLTPKKRMSGKAAVAYLGDLLGIKRPDNEDQGNSG